MLPLQPGQQAQVEALQGGRQGPAAAAVRGPETALPESGLQVEGGGAGHAGLQELLPLVTTETPAARPQPALQARLDVRGAEGGDGQHGGVRRLLRKVVLMNDSDRTLLLFLYFGTV